MKDLTTPAGLPIAMDPRTGRLQFQGDLPAVTPAIRNLSELRAVLQDPAASGPLECYLMYRDVGFLPDRQQLHAAGIRYDITVVAPARLGHEYIKTAGHYHPLAGGATLTYPEIYEVIHGTAHYLLQRAGTREGEVTDAVVVEVHAGELIIVPPNYGHVTINLGDEPLVMSNLVERGFQSIYEPYRNCKGAAYYCVAEDGEPVFVRNPQYTRVPEIRMVPPTVAVDLPLERPEAGLRRGVPLYQAGVSDPGRFAYLVRPQDFPGIMDLEDLDLDGEDEDQ